MARWKGFRSLTLRRVRRAGRAPRLALFLSQAIGGRHILPEGIIATGVRVIDADDAPALAEQVQSLTRWSPSLAIKPRIEARRGAAAENPVVRALRGALCDPEAEVLSYGHLVNRITYVACDALGYRAALCFLCRGNTVPDDVWTEFGGHLTTHGPETDSGESP